MTLTAENILLLGSLMLIVSIVVSKTSARTGVPTALLFLTVGMLAGADGIGGIYFYDPAAAQMIGVVALNFILFSGGMDTKRESVQPILWKGVALSTVGVLLTAAILGYAIYLLTDFTLLEGMLLGSIVSSTDAAAVFSILRARNVGLKRNLRPLLELESGSNDPMAYILTITFTYVLAHGPETTWWMQVIKFLIQMSLGALLGFAFGKGITWVINRIKLDTEGLYPVLLMAFVFLTFAFTDFVGGNGFLAVYLAGIVLGNTEFIHKKGLIKFYDGQAWLMQVILFLTLGLLVFPSEMLSLSGIGIIISLTLIFVARPLAVFLTLAFFKMGLREKLFISWVGLRGAVPIVFATYPVLAGVAKGNMIFNIVFFISVSSVLLQGSTLARIAKWLKLTVPERIRRRSPHDLELEDDGLRSELTEIEIPENSAITDKPVVTLKLPASATIVMLHRNNRYIIPDGATRLQEGDKLYILAGNKLDAAQAALLLTAETEPEEQQSEAATDAES